MRRFLKGSFDEVAFRQPLNDQEADTAARAFSAERPYGQFKNGDHPLCPTRSRPLMRETKMGGNFTKMCNELV